MSMPVQVLGLIAWIFVSFTAAAIGSAATNTAPELYGLLVRPGWAPPSWVFGPVWSLLYLLMGLAAWIVWRGSGFRGAPVALGLFGAQLAANALWSWFFFAWREGALAFAWILVLWLLILATTVAFWRRRRAAGVLLLPYLGWVGFAAVLSLSLWRLNPGVLG